ncbi:MAG: DNA glycosylase [bacterium]
MNEYSFTLNNDVNIDEIATSGQCFRWKKVNSNLYIAPIGSYLLEVRKQVKNKSVVTIYSDMTDKKAKDFLLNYFNLNLDYQKIIDSIIFDPYVKVAVDKAYGLRVLNQDPLETIFSFMLSQNNTVLNVSRCIERICEKNEQIVLDKRLSYFPFPNIETLAKLTIKDYEEMKCGYRARYLNRIAETILKKKMNLERIKKLSSDKLRTKLMEFDGIGEKVADCIMLYSMRKSELVPMDTWVQKASIELYGLRKNCTNKEIREFYIQRFGKYAGWAHLFIFNHARKYSKQSKNIKDCFVNTK